MHNIKVLPAKQPPRLQPIPYRNATGTSINRLAPEVLMNEIAKLINDKPNTMIQAIDTSGYQFNGTTKADLISATASLLHDSEKFRAVVATLIELNTGQITYDQMLVFGSAVPANQKLQAIGGGYHNATDMIGAIFEGIGNTAKGIGDAVSASLMLKATKASAASQVASAQINADAARDTAKEATKVALINAVAAKNSNSGLGISPGAVAAIIVLTGLGAIALYFGLKGSGSNGQSLPAQAPAPHTSTSPSPAPAENKPASAKMETGGNLTPPVTPQVVPPAPPTSTNPAV